MLYSCLLWYLYLGCLAGTFFLVQVLAAFPRNGRAPTTEKQKLAAQIVGYLEEAADLGPVWGALLCLLCGFCILGHALAVVVLWPVWVWKIVSPRGNN